VAVDVVEVEAVRNTNTIRIVAAALAVTLASAPMAAQARESNSKEASSDFGIGVVAVLANVVYMPVKLVYGILGGVTGCFAYVLSGANEDVAAGVWVPSLGGDYVLTTDMMTGRDPVHFNGVREGPGDKPGEEESSGEPESGF
jgi:hypothetical protein